MRTEFRFLFSTQGFIFKKEHKFDGEIKHARNSNNTISDLDNLKFIIRIVPENRDSEETQTGSLFINVPLDKEPAEKLIYELLQLIMHQINFDNAGKFSVSTSILSGERIPETDSERFLIGDKPCFAEVNMVEYLGPPAFDTKKFTSQISATSIDPALVQLHNHASQAKHPIDKFVSYYKIIEGTLYCKKRVPAKELLRNNALLKDIYQSAFNEPQPDKSFSDFVFSIVDIRDNCSHLKRNNDFGYILNDPRIATEVVSKLDLMHYITRQLIIDNSNNV